MGKVYVDGDKDALFAAEIRDASRTTQVPESLIRATIMAESRWDPRAVRIEPGDASYGLMQVTGNTARLFKYKGELGTTDKALLAAYIAQLLPGLYRPRTNIQLGAEILADALRSSGQVVEGAISAYNGGWRPQYGFGKRNTDPNLTVCLARDPNGKCTSSRRVPVGQFGNQPYVDKVLSYYKSYGGLLDANGRAVLGGSDVVLPPKPDIDPLDFTGLQEDVAAQVRSGLETVNSSMEDASGKASTLIYVGIILAIIAALAVFVKGKL